jgi:hypothetical protein
MRPIGGEIMRKNQKGKKDHLKQKPAKKTFVVEDHESLDEVLDRMKAEGYRPVMRVERPVFREGKNGPEVIGRRCIIEGRLDITKGEQ